MSTTLRFSDNYNLSRVSPGNTYIWTTTFGAGLVDNTSIDSVRAAVSGDARVWDVPEVGTEAALDNPLLLLNWNRNVDDNSVGFNFRYNKVDIDFFDPLRDINPDGSFDDTRGGGSRQTLRAGFTTTVNEDGPVSFDLAARYDGRRYFDTIDPGLYDRDLYFARAEFGFNVNRQVSLTAGASYRYREQDDRASLTRTTTRVDTGLDMLIDSATRASLRIGYSEVDTQRQRGIGDTFTQGFVGGLDISRDVTNGSYSAGLNSTLDEAGYRNTIFIGRSFDTQNGEFNARLGASASELTNVRPVGFINYTHERPTSELRFGFRQNATLDDNSRNVLNSNGSIGYRKFLTDLSSVDFSLAAGLIRYENSDQPDSERVTFNASYRRALTSDWDMNVGYRHRYRDARMSDGTRANDVFFTLERDFEALR